VACFKELFRLSPKTTQTTETSMRTSDDPAQTGSLFKAVISASVQCNTSPVKSPVSLGCSLLYHDEVLPIGRVLSKVQSHEDVFSA